MILQEEIKSAVSINRITRALPVNGEESYNLDDRTPMPSSEDQVHQPKEKPRKEYAVERVVGHTNTENGTRYCVQ